MAYGHNACSCDALSYYVIHCHMMTSCYIHFNSSNKRSNRIWELYWSAKLGMQKYFETKHFDEYSNSVIFCPQLCFFFLLATLKALISRRKPLTKLFHTTTCYYDSPKRRHLTRLVYIRLLVYPGPVPVSLSNWRKLHCHKDLWNDRDFSCQV